MTAHHAATLNDRERRMLTLASEGMSTKDIAHALMIAPRTVDQHFEKMRTKIGARNRTHLVVRGLPTRLSTPANGLTGHETSDTVIRLCRG